MGEGHERQPRGRAPGCHNRATRAAEALLDGEAEALTRKAVELAMPWAYADQVP